MMNRRDFIKRSLLTSAYCSTGLGSILASGKAHSASLIPPTLVNVMLVGGADFRYLFVPAPDHADVLYVEKFWDARKKLYTPVYPDYATMYADLYVEVTDNGFSFGIHKEAQWLIDEFNNGNVSVVANVFGSINRRHDHSQLIVETGDPDVSRIDTTRDGWGGRLVENIAGDAKMLSVSPGATLFVNGTDSNNRLQRTFQARDFRDVSLPTVDSDPDKVATSRNVLVRALHGYYRDRGAEIDIEKNANWPYRKFFQHYQSLNDFGSLIDTSLSGVPLPAALADLDQNLNDTAFAQQCKNLYDGCFLFNILGTRAVSMRYGGWDSHVLQEKALKNNFADIFGVAGGLATVINQLDINAPGTSENLTFVFNSDFGRQLAANGSRGTDHGTASYSIVYGKDVNGGVHGEMFPSAEAVPVIADSLGRSLMELPGTDIEGLTSVRRIMAMACDWVAAGSGEVVFPDYSSSEIEAGVNLDNII